MEFKKHILQNGLVIIGELNPAAKSAAVGFFVKTGSRDESPEINGVSHFLEHMVFKGTEDINALAVNQAFDLTGAQYNASTSEEATVYYAAVLPEYLEEITRLWSKLMRPALRTRDFEIEKNVIKEEISMYKDIPSFDVSDKCRSLHFEGHPCGNSVLGTEKGIDNLTAEQMKGYFSSRYSPDNMQLCCAGNFSWDKICSIAAKNCAQFKTKASSREISDFPGSNKSHRIGRKNLTSEHICLISRAVSAQDERRFAAGLLGSIVGDGQASRFYWELVDKALAETATMQFDAMDGTGLFYSYIRCSRENVDKVMDKITSILRQLRQNGITTQELQRAKNKTLSSLVIKNEIPMGRFAELGFNWMYLQKYRTLQDDVTSIRAVTVDDVNQLIEALGLAEFTEYHLGPDK